jgi:NADH:ubiquinone oxidoreductase subunit E
LYRGPVDRSGAPRNLEKERALRALARCAEGDDPGELAAAVQRALGYVAPVSIPMIAVRSGCTPEAVESLLADRAELLTTPHARHRVAICTGKTCARRGGAALVRSARHALGIEPYETTEDGGIRLEPFRCFGQCAQAPNIRIDGGTRGAMTERRLELLLGVIDRPAR